MIAVPDPSGRVYCVDATEVTQQQYKSFLDTLPDPAAQQPPCDGNASFSPASSCQFDWQSRRPVACVDWCDARAFCSKYGKRLCGAIGGGTLRPADATDPTKSEWFNACSRGGTRLYAYGDNYSMETWDTCQGLESAGSTVSVGSKLECQGGYSGLFDMSGNVREWEGACDGAGLCASRGGGFLDSGYLSSPTPESLRCSSARLVPLTQAEDERGFRCCADLK
jgi:formylglycine-generating enzyme